MLSKAKESIKEHVTEHLPEQYQVCLTAVDSIIKRAFDILETSPDNREKLQAMELPIPEADPVAYIDSALHSIRDNQQQAKGIALD